MTRSLSIHVEYNENEITIYKRPGLLVKTSDTRRLNEIAVYLCVYISTHSHVASMQQHKKGSKQ